MPGCETDRFDRLQMLDARNATPHRNWLEPLDVGPEQEALPNPWGSPLEPLRLVPALPPREFVSDST